MNLLILGASRGLENTRMPEVAYSASKSGLRGVAHALRDRTVEWLMCEGD